MVRSRNFWRLFGAYGALVLCAIGLLGAVIVARVEAFYLGQLEDDLRARALLVREAVQDRPAPQLVPVQERLEALGARLGTRITLIDAAGQVLVDSERDPRRRPLDNHADRPEVQDARQHGVGISRHRYSGTVHEEMMYVAVRAEDGAGPVAFVRVAVPLTQVRHQLAELARLVWTAAGLTAAAALALAGWLARRAARPLQELTRGAERIAAGGYGHKVYLEGPDEVGTLARTFNRMSERLADQFTQLEEDRQKLRAVLGGMVEGVVALDPRQRILFTNDRAGQLLGFDPAAAAGRRLWEVVRLRPLTEVVRRVLEGPETWSEALDCSGPAARHLTVHAARLSGPPARGVVLVFHDTSELRRLERLRQEFVANVSHELKTPLAVIKACVETLIDGAAEDAEYRGSFLQQIAEQADRLHALILDLLSLARLEAGSESFEFQAVPLGESVQACLESHRARAESRRQRLEAVPPDGAGEADAGGAVAVAAEVAAWADAEAVGQILDNLVDNAVKYTPEGGHIRVAWRADGAQVCLEVRDNGIGIPERDLPRVFERFYRVDKARSRELGGTGLGLSIVKHLVGAMHGSVHAASQFGHGTTFEVRLPRATAAG